MHPKLKKLQGVATVPKGWGSEFWLVNNEDFCAKILRFNKGSKFSYHFHKEKREVFYVVKGYLKVIGINTENAEEYIMFLQKGEILDIPRGAIHRLEALEESEIWEISTHHEDSDSYRVKPGDSQK